MNYEKKYKEALEKAKNCLKDDTITNTAISYIRTIFPELKESEDERILKNLKAVVKAYDMWAERGLDMNDILAWLEKQGEHAKFRDSIQVGDKVTRNEDGVLVNLSQLNRVAKKDEKQGEQKPQGKSALEAINEEKVDNANIVAKKDEKKGEKPRYSIGDVLCDKSCTTLNKDAQPNFEIVAIKNGLYICDKGYIPISQQDEYELVAKKIDQNPAWSEEDELIINKILCICNDFEKSFEISPASTKVIKEDVNKIDNWLKSLKERYTWKPSDEQIKVLVEVLIFAANKESPHWNDYIYGILKNLTRQLKKLMEE
jgi:hypothetical protein